MQYDKNTETTFFSLICTSQYISPTKTIIKLPEDHVPENPKYPQQQFASCTSYQNRRHKNFDIILRQLTAQGVLGEGGGVWVTALQLKHIIISGALHTPSSSHTDPEAKQ